MAYVSLCNKLQIRCLSKQGQKLYSTCLNEIVCLWTFMVSDVLQIAPIVTDYFIMKVYMLRVINRTFLIFHGICSKDFVLVCCNNIKGFNLYTLLV